MSSGAVRVTSVPGDPNRYLWSWGNGRPVRVRKPASKKPLRIEAYTRYLRRMARIDYTNRDLWSALADELDSNREEETR